MSETTTEIPTLDLVEVNQRIADGLARVEEVKHKIEIFKEQSNSVKIIDENDKDGYAATKEFLSEVRPIRTGLENERKAVVKPFNDLISNVNDVYKNATSQLAAIEAPHKQQKELFEVAEEARKAEAAAAKEKIINDKIALLLENGLEYNAFNGYYKNDMGRAITRMDITNMQTEDFEMFLVIVKSDFVAKNKAEEIEKEAVKKYNDRRNELSALSIPQNLACFFVTNVESNEIMVELLFEDLKTLGDDAFENIKDKIVSVMAANTAYYKKMKDDAADLKAKQLKDEQDLKDRENKIAEKELELKRAQIKLIHSKLPAFNFQYATPIENSLFVYQSISVSLSEIFANDDEINIANSKVAELIKEGEVAANKKIEDDKVEAENELKIKQEAEAKKKRLSKKEIAISDPCVSEMFGQVALLKKAKFELINQYAETFVSSVEAAIDKYNNDLRHLR